MANNKKSSPHPPSQKPAPKQMDKIKSSVFTRGLSLAKMTLQAGTQLAAHNLKHHFSSPEEKNKSWMDFVKTQAGLVSAELGELKGSLMKAGQMLSMYGEHFLPPEANALLKSLQADSPALKWDAIEPVLRKNLPKDRFQELEIEKEALSCASLGQVHRARIKATGEEIVLKIQYPNVDQAITSDLKALRTLLGVLKLVPKDLNLDPLFREVHEMLVQETDYELEASLTEKFAHHLRGDARYVVPKVYRAYSNKKILATSYEPCLRVDSAEVQALPQERRNQIALQFLDLFFKELFHWRTVQTDPHIGNYGLRLRSHAGGPDRLVLFDFGATREYPKPFVDSYREMLRGALFAEESVFRRAAQALHLITPSDDAELKALFEEFCFEFVEPFLSPDDPRLPPGAMDEEGRYDWKNSDLPQRLSKKIFSVIRRFSWRTPPREILFLDRKTGGVFIFMAVMRAHLRGRECLLQYLEPPTD